MALTKSDIQYYLTELLLMEDIDAVKRQYPKIEDEDFDRLIRLDPTFKEGKDSVGTYGKWILNLFNKGIKTIPVIIDKIKLIIITNTALVNIIIRIPLVNFILTLSN